jgi:hypothetical protein
LPFPANTGQIQALVTQVIVIIENHDFFSAIKFEHAAIYSGHIMAVVFWLCKTATRSGNQKRQ